MDILLSNIEIILKSTILIAIASGIMGSLVVIKKDTLSIAVISNTQFVLSILIAITVPLLNTHIAHLAVISFALLSIYSIYITDKYSKLQRIMLYPLISSLAFGISLAILTFIDRNIMNERIEYSKYLLGSVHNVVSFKDSTLLYSSLILALIIMFSRHFIISIVNSNYERRKSFRDNMINLLYYILLAGIIYELNKIVGVLISPVILVLPAISARLLSSRLKSIVTIAIIISVIGLALGIALSFIIPKIAPGILTVIILGVIFFISILINYKLNRKTNGGR